MIKFYNPNKGIYVFKQLKTETDTPKFEVFDDLNEDDVTEGVDYI